MKDIELSLNHLTALHSSTIEGHIGLYTDIGTDGYFKNLKVEVLD